MQKFILKKDSYREARGPWSRFYNISCRKCEQVICVYQKDGPGELRRLYLDRMHPFSGGDLKNKSSFICHNCKEILGVYYMYEKESRQAIRLFVGAVTKKLFRKDI